MHQLLKIYGKFPQVHKEAFIASTCVLIGDVIIGKNSSVWFNAVLRADQSPIIVGENSNIQDGAIIHVTAPDGGTTIGDNVTIGHKVLLHGCTIKNNALIGMNATVMDKAIVEEFGFVGAGSLVTPGKVVKSREMWMGSPAKLVRTLTEEEVTHMTLNASVYVTLANEYKSKL
eukprot:Platyproteum_vivax@DN7355_c0_g1_i2.p2